MWKERVRHVPCHDIERSSRIESLQDEKGRGFTCADDLYLCFFLSSPISNNLDHESKLTCSNALGLG